MELSSFFRLCIYFTICLIIFLLCVNFVSGMGIFSPVETDMPSSSGHDAFSVATNVFVSVTGFSGGVLAVFALLSTIGGIAAVGLALVLRNTNVIAVYLFSVLYWTSFNGFFNTVNINNFIPFDFLVAILVGLFFLWVAAIMGMLTILQ